MDNKRVRENNVSKRIPLSEQSKSVMTVPKKAGWVRRFVNDDPKHPGVRIGRFLKAGWRIVEDDVDVGTEGVVNQNQSLGSGARKYVGGGMHAVLMEIEEQYYSEDQELKAMKIDQLEAQIRNGQGIDDKLKIGEVTFEDRYTKVVK